MQAGMECATEPGEHPETASCDIVNAGGQARKETKIMQTECRASESLHTYDGTSLSSRCIQAAAKSSRLLFILYVANQMSWDNKNAESSSWKICTLQLI